MGRGRGYTRHPAEHPLILNKCLAQRSNYNFSIRTDAIYRGKVIYTPSGLLDLIPDHYKQKPISIYDPRGAPLLNQYRLIVPRTRNILEVIQYITLIVLYVAFMTENDPSKVTTIEICFLVYAFGWSLEQFATILGHGW